MERSAGRPPDDLTQTEGGTRHRALATGPDGVRAVTVDEAVRRMDRGAPEPSSKPGPLVWIDIVRPTEEDGNYLRDGMRFHPLAVEDCLQGLQNPKLERYPGYFFIVLYAARINPERNRPAFYELHCFMGPNYIVTVRHESVREVREVMARWRAGPQHFPTVGHLAHGLLDAIVDSYFPMVDHFAVRVDKTENEVYDMPSDAMQHIVGLRRELLRFRNVVGPVRDMLASVVRRDLPFLNPDLMPYFQDVRDHTVRITEEIDVLRDLLSTAVEAQFTVTSNQLNQTMRVLTAWAIILMSMTLIVGVYGMNFDFMPELNWRFGYPLALLIMVAVGSLIFLFFRRRHWL
jgi:magnesium transporter